MHNNLITYVWQIEGKLVEIKEMSKYSSKVRAKRIAGAGVDIEFIGVKRDE